MTIDEIYKLRHSGYFANENVPKIDLFLQAVTDWPTEVNTVRDFLTEIGVFLKIDSLTYESISTAIKKIEPANHLWQLESLTSILELIKINNSNKLEQFLQLNNIID
jgi:hypothetical protein